MCRSKMPVVRLLRLSLLMVLAGCGGSAPSAPTPSTNTPTLLNPASGTYQLTITMSQVGQQCGGSGCFSSGLCIIASGATPPPPVTAAVQLTRTGDDLVVNGATGPSTFAMQLHMSGADLSGTASGSFTDGKTTLTLGFSSQSALAVAGTRSATTIHGTFEGQLGSGSYSCSNNGHLWTLTPSGVL